MSVAPETRQALVLLKSIIYDMGAEMVVIGAVAYGVWIDDPWRSTGDVDVAVAIDVDEIKALDTILRNIGWQRHPRQEQRWTTQEGTVIDIIPAGPAPALRGEPFVRWPESGFTMNLAGFQHVFARAVLLDLGEGVTVKVVPLPVFALAEDRCVQGQTRDR